MATSSILLPAVRPQGHPNLSRRLSVAPMMDHTDRHCRYFLRLLSSQTLLYTEMVTTGALLHGDWERLLAFSPEEHPLALQLGGSEPQALAACARMAEDRGYDEVNFNVGCPSDRVQSGRFGACLMHEPTLVAHCVAAMRAAVRIPVTVKTRLGVDDRDSYEHLIEFVQTVAESGCRSFILHARKAWLQGLSPRENREIPPLRHDVVHRLKRDFPHLEIIINGGFASLDEVCGQLRHVDGVMIGRQAYHNPYLLAEADARLFALEAPAQPREQIVRRMLPYIEAELSVGTRLSAITRHMLGLFQGRPGARTWRRELSARATRTGAGLEVVDTALRAVTGA